MASELDLNCDIELNSRVKRLEYDGDQRKWAVTTAEQQMTAQFVIMATGCLSIPLDVSIPGLESFTGKIYRTSSWPHCPVDFQDLRVGLVGTGSSGVQIAPILAREARHLTVFQRTPNYSIPAHNHTLEPEFIKQWKAEYPARRKAARLGRNFTVNDAGTVPGRNHTFEQREREFERRWNETGGIGFMYAFPDMTIDSVVNEHASDFVNRKIREIVRDQEVAALLCPRDYGIGGKRICVDTGYFEMFNRTNVSLIDVKKDPIVRVTATGIANRSREISLDAIVLALGFDAMTGALLKVDIRGRDGISLRDRWRDGPRTYLGLAVSSFPNLFIVTGPGSPSVFANMVTSIEQHVDWIAGCMLRMRERGYICIEATAKAEADWVAHVAEVGAPTALAKASNSWYVGANVQGKPRVVMPYMGGAPQYEEICNRVAAEDYEGFVRA